MEKAFTLRPYFAMLRMRFIARLQYRAAAWAGIATQLFFGGMFVMLYSAFYSSSTAAQPIEHSQLMSYLWLRQAFLALFASWSNDSELHDLIEKGDIAYEMCRPYNLYSIWVARLVAHRISDATLRCLPIIIIALLIPQPYGLSLPASPLALLLFFVSMALGMLVLVGIGMFMYIWTFKTLSAAGPRAIIGGVTELFMGALIPIPLMPDALQKIMSLLPFAYMQDLPLRIYSGNIAAGEALVKIGIQIVWAALLLFVGSRLFSRALRRVVVQGG